MPVIRASDHGVIVVVSGPSGVGKGTIIQKLLTQNTTVKLAISATTRAPRVGEVNGVDYYFLPVSEFDQRIADDQFVEWCEVHGNKYGTLASEILANTQQGYDVLLEIDTQGAKKVRAKLGTVLSIFIAPPSLDELAKRLMSRNTEKEEEISRRLSAAKGELAEVGDYDCVVVNRELEGAVEDVMRRIRDYKLGAVTKVAPQ